MTDLPLSAAQERLWFLQQVDPADPSHHISHNARVTGPLDAAALTAALGEIVARHDALRARFPLRDDVPVQVIDSYDGFELERVNHTGGPVEALAGALVDRPFDLTRDRLIRATLIAVGPEDHVLSVVMHHIVGDLQSFAVLLSELSQLYEAFIAGLPSPLPPLAAQWADVQQIPDSPEDLAYWKRELAEVPPLEVATDRPRPLIATSDSALYEHSLPVSVAKAFTKFARSQRCTPFMALITVYQALLAGRSGQQDFCIGFATGGRDKIEYERLIGCFVNTVVLRCDLSGDPSFSELLARTRSRLLEGRNHQRLQFGRVLNELGLERDLSRTPLFQTTFGMNYGLGEHVIRLAHTECRWIKAGFAHSPLELRLDVMERRGEWQLLLVYNRGLFDEDTIAGYIRDYESMLMRIAEDPEIRISRLIAPAGAERDRLLNRWNQALPPDLTLFADLFAAQVRARPDAVAVGAGPERLTYAQVDRRADALAARLGVRRGERIAVCLPRTADLVPVLLGVHRAGAAYVPLDPDYPGERLRFVLSDSAASLVVATRETAAALPPHALPTLLTDEPSEDGAPPRLEAHGGDTAYVLYTSGSTGRPKGVMVPHAALGNFLAGMRDLIGSGPGDVWLGVTSLSFDICGLELYLPLATGGRVEICDAATARDGHAQTRLIKTAGVTHVQTTPSGWRMLLDCGFDEPAITGLVGGEALTTELAARLDAAVGRLINVYGPTETTIWSTSWSVPHEPRAVRLGDPIRGTQIYVVDDQLEPVRTGVPGELVIGGAGVSLGYLGRPALTAERFTPDPYGTPGGRLYRTGDVVRRLPDGGIEYVGRRDNQVKIRGYRIELGEVESACEAIPGVDQAIAAAHDDNLIVYLVGAAEPEHVRATLAERLPGYLVPARLIPLDALPLTPNGKLDRSALPAPSAERSEFVPPRSDAEQLIADIWCEVLGLDQVGALDDFYRLGGHSLLAVRVSARILGTAGVELPILDLFTNRTVATLAAHIEQLLIAELSQLSVEEVERQLDTHR
ncbi:amino acid adenylation domain-containing protein [Streptosporangiaceae bacterium NEAU-GS5]|nr:amino acid adenylation domain-containing protein [Streptosporangiaceae bacterium NEAU-GS5]